MGCPGLVSELHPKLFFQLGTMTAIKLIPLECVVQNAQLAKVWSPDLHWHVTICGFLPQMCRHQSHPYGSNGRKLYMAWHGLSSGIVAVIYVVSKQIDVDIGVYQVWKCPKKQYQGKTLLPQSHKLKVPPV